MAKIDKLAEQAREHLDPDEQVEAVVLGTYETKILGSDSVRTGIMLATARRVVFYAKKMTGYDLESFPYESISSFEAGKNMMGRHFKFVAGGNSVSLKWIKEGDIDKFATLVRERAGARSVAAPAPAGGGLADELAKLAALRDQGILTPAEFEAQKARLLAA
jgi:PH (Pleckstrin Homology) domain-containing protein/putative oligomerization/nucleic acid binding protein